MATSLEQAVITAFATYLDSALSSLGYTIYDRWPEGDVELSQSISVIRSAPRTIQYIDPTVVGSVDVNSTTANFSWLLGFCTQPIQLDVWAASDIKRDDAMGRLDILLHAGATPAGFLNQNPVEAITEVTLDPTSGWSGQADFQFDEPALIETADAVGQREYRAMYSGNAYFPLTIQAVSPKIAKIILDQKLSETLPLGDNSIPIYETTITS